MKTILRRKLCVLALCALLLNLLIVSAAAVEPSRVTVELRPSVTILVDGVERTFFDVKGREVHTIYYNGTHYLPVRAIGELMGKNVNWDGSTQTITLSSPRTAAAASGSPDLYTQDSTITVELRPDISIVVDGVKRNFTDAKGRAVYPLLNNGTNYLPVRAIGELMNKSVSWNGQTRTISLTGSGPLVTDADTFGPSPSTPSNPQQPAAPALIGEAAAKNAALANAGLKSSQVAYTKFKLDWDDGVQIYEIEFYNTANYQSYAYEIDAKTGAVLSMTYQASGGAQSGGSVYIGEEKARSIALARVPGATADAIRELKLDQDDGRWEYEIELVYNQREYEFTLDAFTGTVLKWSTEVLR